MSVVVGNAVKEKRTALVTLLTGEVIHAIILESNASSLIYRSAVELDQRTPHGETQYRLSGSVFLVPWHRIRWVRIFDDNRGMKYVEPDNKEETIHAIRV